MRIGCFTVPDPWFRSPFFDLLYLSGTRYSNYGYSETGSEFQKRWSCGNNATTSRGPPLPNLPLDSISCPPPCRNQSWRVTIRLSSARGGSSLAGAPFPGVSACCPGASSYSYGGCSCLKQSRRHRRQGDCPLSLRSFCSE